MIIKKTLLTLIVAFGLLTSIHAFAHAMLEKSNPADGEVLKTPPKEMLLRFNHPAKLAMFKLIIGDKSIPIAVDTTAAASTTFTVHLPALEKGKYQVRWSALSGDSHAMTGTLSFTISP